MIPSFDRAVALHAFGALVLSAACTAPKLPIGVFACTRDVECPSGLVCGGSSICIERMQGPDAGPSRSDAGSRCSSEGTPPLDVLVVVDNSNSMAEEQEMLAAQFPALLRTLTTGDTDGDGDLDVGYAPVRDVHFGVVSTDMGAGGWSGQVGCSDDSDGDDGVLRQTGNTTMLGCVQTYPAWLDYQSADDNPTDASADFSCVARMGTGGCGFEQQLEAAHKALTPSDALACPTSESRCVFRNNTFGQGDQANAGFLRDNAVLALIILTDEEDCSAGDVDLFNPASSMYPGALGLRCFLHREDSALYSIDRYVDGFAALKPSPDMLFYSIIAGVPEDLTAEEPNFPSILADKRMVPRPNESNDRLVPSCEYNGAGLSTADPPTRMVQVAEGLAAQGVSVSVQSICTDLVTPLQRIAKKIGEVVDAAPNCEAE